MVKSYLFFFLKNNQLTEANQNNFSLFNSVLLYYSIFKLFGSVFVKHIIRATHDSVHSKLNSPCPLIITVDFAAFVERNWDDSVVCSEVSPYQIVDSEHLMPCHQMHLVNHVAAAAAAAAVWASYHWDCHLPC